MTTRIFFLLFIIYSFLNSRDLKFTILYSSNEKVIYQSSHLDFLFMGEPLGHLKAAENSSKFDNGPLTLYWLGECTSVLIYTNN